MKDQDKTKAQLISELEELRGQVAAMDSVEIGCSRSDQELRHSEAKWRSVAENAPIFVSIVDQSGKMQFLNRYRPGFEPATVLGRSIYDFLQPQSHAVARKCLEHVFQTGERASYECVGAGPEGRVCDYLTDVGPVMVDGRVIAATLMARDMTERIRAEAKIVAEHALLEGVIESTSYPVFSVDSNYCYTSFNRSHAATMKAIYGADIELGKSLLEYPTTPQDRSIAKANLDRTLRGERLVLEEYVGDAALSRPCFEISHNPIKGSDGEVVGVAVFAKDITEKKRAEETLKESEERFRQAMEATNDGLWDWNVESGDVYYSPAYYRMLGYEAAEFANRKESWTELLHPDDLAEAIRVNQDCIENRIPQFEVEFRMRTKGGGWKTILGRGKAVCRDADGRAIRMIGTHVDITERRRAEEDLREGRRQLSTLMANLPGMAYRCRNGPQWTMEFISDGCVLLTGYTPSAFTDNHEVAYGDIIHADDQERVWKEVQQAIAEGRHFQLEYRIHTASGEEKWVWEQGVAISSESGQVEALEGLMTDITDRKRAEETLRQSEERLRRFYESGLLGVIYWQMDGHIIDANDKFLEMVGYERADLVAGRIDWVNMTPPEYRHLDDRSVEELKATGVNNLAFEKEYIRKDGMRVPVILAGAMLDEARFNGVAFVLDITERKRAEEELKKAHDELERRVEERTAQLSAANEQLRVFQQFAEASGQGFSMADLSGHLLYLNPALCRMLGEDKPQDRIGQHLSIYYPDEANRTRETERFPALMRDGYWQGELPMLSCQGKCIPTWHSTFLIRDESGKPFRIAVVITDITERKRAEEALRQSEEKYRLLVETTGTGYLILDGQGRIIDANAEYIRISGHRTLEEILGRTVVEWTAHYDVERNAKEVEKCYRIGFTRQLEIDYVHPDGKIIPIDINATCLDTEDGRQIVCLCRDITERRQAQEALERERQSLWRMLQASDHERQLISYEIHDGLAQYLGGAIMQFQAHDALRENSPDEAKKAHETAVELVRQAHSESRRLISEVRPPIIDENGIEMAISHLVFEQRRRGGPKIDSRSSVQFGRLPSILENAIYRIAQEALSNACNHSKSKKVTVTLAQEGQEVRLEVQDWGIGFDPESVEKGHFGLEGIRQRVRLLGGRLKIESTPGAGTLVQTVVPIVEKKGEA